MISLTRRYHFPASHRLHSPRLSPAENTALYGKCDNPHGHGHDYALAVTVTGDPDPASGLLLPIARLDDFVFQRVLRLFAYRNINVDLPQFGELIPTTENVASVIAELVCEHWHESFGDLNVRVSGIHLQETERNGVELRLPAPARRESAEWNERVTVHA